jgi:hypothetical protein
MTTPRKALVLVGSPKPGGSASGTLAAYVAEALAARDWQVESVRTNRSLKTDEGTRSLLCAFDAAEAIVLIFPLYIDSLPAGLTRTLEVVAEHRRAARSTGQQRMSAVCQNGFPEAHQNATALEICRLFCREVGIQWAGGLAFGGGGPLEGRELKKMGGMARNVINALDRACSDLSAGLPVSAEAAALMAKPMVPRWLYVAIGSYGWRQLAKKNGVRGRLRDQPCRR